ncbi:MAG: hypothetical protein HY202_05485 [Nitrospirae bacterium]|nr:hypothetical protein [Nitrospirota bacterium]
MMISSETGIHLTQNDSSPLVGEAGRGDYINFHPPPPTKCGTGCPRKGGDTDMNNTSYL